MKYKLWYSKKQEKARGYNYVLMNGEWVKFTEFISNGKNSISNWEDKELIYNSDTPPYIRLSENSKYFIDASLNYYKHRVTEIPEKSNLKDDIFLDVGNDLVISSNQRKIIKEDEEKLNKIKRIMNEDPTIDKEKLQRIFSKNNKNDIEELFIKGPINEDNEIHFLKYCISDMEYEIQQLKNEIRKLKEIDKKKINKYKG